MSNKFDINEEVPARESLAPAGADAFTALRGSVVEVLDSVVREYEPQIQQFTANIAHTAVDKGVELAQGAVAQVRKQSWARLALAGALGVGLIAVLTYEAEKSAAPRKRVH